jgi:hypothetical protein
MAEEAITAPITHYESITRKETRNTARLERNITRDSRKSFRDPNLDVNLPYRTLSAAANLDEYTTEQPSGTIPGPEAEDGTKRKLVTFVPNDPANPKNWSKAFKWYCTVCAHEY